MNLKQPGPEHVRRILIFAAVVLVIGLVIRGVGNLHIREVREGTAFLEERESGDVEAVRANIKKLQTSQRTTALNAHLEQIESGQTDLWKEFENVFLIGDSRMNGFESEMFLSDRQIYAGEEMTLKEAEDGIEKALEQKPAHLVFSFGLDDSLGIWANKEEFISGYDDVISQYKRALPDADVYLCSIAAPTDQAIQEVQKLRNVPSFDTEIRDLCEQKKYNLIECSSLYDEHVDLYAQDGIHFQTEMYPHWGLLIIEAVLRGESNVPGLRAEAADGQSQRGEALQAEAADGQSQREEALQAEAADGQSEKESSESGGEDPDREETVDKQEGSD